MSIGTRRLSWSDTTGGDFGRFRGSDHAASKPELFDDVHPLAWLGPRETVFCVDYSVGARYEERKKGVTQFETRLAALRWPEREVWGEEGPLNVL